jgi:hypothetical protein
MGIAGLVLAAAAVLQAGQSPARHPQPLPEPLAKLARIEIHVTTRTGTLVQIAPGLAAAAVRSVSGPPGTARVAGDLLFFSGWTSGEERTAVFRAVIATEDTGTPIVARFPLASGPPVPPSTLVIYNVNDEARPIEVARADSRQTVQLPVTELRTNGPLATPAPRDRLVLAHYYPWWDRASWADPRLLDTPRQLYSTDDATDVARVLRDMRAAGIDVAIVSWQGSESRGGFYARGLRHVLDAAQQADVRVSVMLETAAANRVREGEPADVDVLTGWMTELIDGYATHPAFLKIDGRPVLFAYIWGFAGRDVWQTVLSRVRAGGRQPLLIADTTSPSELALADGTFTYSGTLFEPDVPALIRRSVSGARAYHLLGTGFGAPRIAAASVIPGYDETRLGRDTRRAVDRQDGEFYDRQWQAALAANPDWVVITSWNEWAENTQIEAGQRFGEIYVWRTRFWSAAFRHAPR